MGTVPNRTGPDRLLFVWNRSTEMFARDRYGAGPEGFQKDRKLKPQKKQAQLFPVFCHSRKSRSGFFQFSFLFFFSVFCHRLKGTMSQRFCYFHLHPRHSQPQTLTDGSNVLINIVTSIKTKLLFIGFH